MKYVACLVVGVVLGIGGAWFLHKPLGKVSDQGDRYFMDLYSVMVFSDLQSLEVLRNRQESKLMSDVEARLPGYVLKYANKYSSHPSAKLHLWKIKGYYKKYALSVPEKVKSILDAVPDEPPSGVRLTSDMPSMP